MTQTEIVCSECGKSAKINKVDGRLCLSCWRRARIKKRNIRLRDSLDHCLSYYSNFKLSDKEISLIKDVLNELNKPKAL